MVPLLFGISIVLFAVIQAAPGGPEGSLLSSGRFVDPQVVEAYRHGWAWTGPFPCSTCAGWAPPSRGDLGMSFSTTRPVAR